MKYNHCFPIPLNCDSPATFSDEGTDTEGKMKHIDLSDQSILTSSFHNSPRMPRNDLPNIELFKDLMSSQCEKEQLLNENVKFLRKEIETKNRTIDRLMTFIANVIGANYECVPNNDEKSPEDVPSRSSTPTKYKNVTARRKTKSDEGEPESPFLSTFEDSDLLDNYESEDVVGETLEVRTAKQLRDVRREKHDRFQQLKQNTVVEQNNNSTTKSVKIIDDDDESDVSDTTTTNKDVHANKDDNISDTEINDWEKHTNGFARKEMSKYGYQGKGLGKKEDGITEPIVGKKKTAFDSSDTDVAWDAWPKNTVLFAGDSMYNQIDERRIARSVMGKFRVKVRAHPGATVGDMKHHLTAWLRKRPSHLVIHVGTNDATNKKSTAEEIYNELLELKAYAESIVPGIRVFISCPIVRRDDKSANMKVISVRAKLRAAKINDLITNENIGMDLLGKRGLHLSFHKGVGSLAKNMIEHLKSL